MKKYKNLIAYGGSGLFSGISAGLYFFYDIYAMVAFWVIILAIAGTILIGMLIKLFLED